MNRFEEKTLAGETIYEGKIITLRLEEVELPDGKTAKRELIKHPGAVSIIPITKEGKLVLVEQYRKALERSLIEIPAGKIDPGEAPEVTAVRELEEETGYGAKEFTYLQSFATSPGFADEVIHLYVAQGLYKVENPAAGDEDEFIGLLEVTIEEAEEMVASGKIFDAKTAFAVLYAKNLLNK
ncbi:NUDIX hydrolase [Sporosarcina sp. ACRSM]|uniref:NUDIX domain-containing protein n=1 Tax=Sporosarcina sp. ACRSM TaxID=2918216 RepID=UPI001EF50B63|nr:NUDIX hydrolase [Sporosarcina sp. ACRSM]MCG7333929.1 NUDIX hydrolase [Sporosarcina sp. ACRSM]